MAGTEEEFPGAALCEWEDFEDDDRAAILVSVDWHFSCCCLNLLRLSCNAIWKTDANIPNCQNQNINSYALKIVRMITPQSSFGNKRK